MKQPAGFKELKEEREEVIHQFRGKLLLGTMGIWLLGSQEGSAKIVCK